MTHRFFRIAAALAVFAAIPAPAHAQFGKLGDAIKKKAKEVGAQAVGKDDPKQEGNTSSSSSSRSPNQLAITSDVLDSFVKGINVETEKRSAYVKRRQCEQSAIQSSEYMQMMAAQGEAMGNQMKDDMTDAQKMAIMQKAGEEMQKKQLAYVARKCGAVVEQPEASAMEAAGAEAAGFTQAQYGYTKERIIAYCDAVAHGTDTPDNHVIVFSEAEMAVLKPRCATLGKQLKQIS